MVCPFDYMHTSSQLKWISQLSDINECAEETDRCEVDCANTIGSYSCNCNSGFIIDADGITCNGEHAITYIL